MLDVNFQDLETVHQILILRLHTQKSNKASDDVLRESE